MAVDYKSYDFQVYKHLVLLQQELKKCIRCPKTEEWLRKVIAEQERIKTRRFCVAVVGEFKRGKSSFINALLGQRVLPVDISPTTAVINRITYGDVPKAYIYCKDGSSFKIEMPNEQRTSYRQGMPSQQSTPNQQGMPNEQRTSYQQSAPNQQTMSYQQGQQINPQAGMLGGGVARLKCKMKIRGRKKQRGEMFLYQDRMIFSPDTMNSYGTYINKNKQHEEVLYSDISGTYIRKYVGVMIFFYIMILVGFAVLGMTAQDMDELNFLFVLFLIEAIMPILFYSTTRNEMTVITVKGLIINFKFIKFADMVQAYKFLKEKQNESEGIQALKNKTERKLRQ